MSKLEITLYTIPGDEHSTMAKKLLQEHDVDFKEVDVMASEDVANELAKQTGQLSVPALVAKDADSGEVTGIVVGYDPSAIKQTFNLESPK